GVPLQPGAGEGERGGPEGGAGDREPARCRDARKHERAPVPGEDGAEEGAGGVGEEVAQARRAADEEGGLGGLDGGREEEAEEGGAPGADAREAEPEAEGEEEDDVAPDVDRSARAAGEA